MDLANGYTLCVCVCVCVVQVYVKGTKCPHKDDNFQNHCPCGAIFGPHEETSL